VTDDRPRIEHAAWVRRGEFQRVLPRVLALATDVPVGGDERFKPEVDAERGAFLSFYRAALQIYDRDPQAAAAILREVLRRDPDRTDGCCSASPTSLAASREERQQITTTPT